MEASLTFEKMILPTPRLFRPKAGKLRPTYSEAEDLQPRARRLESEIQGLISQKNYPCVAALKSYHRDDYQVGFYDEFGTGQSWKDLRRDLQYFVQEQQKSASIYLSFWAVFKDALLSEEEYEEAMWRELSSLTSSEDRERDWGQSLNSDPNEPAFRFSLEGREFFVVGMHPKSSRLARQISAPTMIFNVSSQFEALEKLGQYDAMVKTNRKRDSKFQGSVNPMVAAHGEAWESIQFSGRQNDSKSWKCPFQFLSRFAKP